MRTALEGQGMLRLKDLDEIRIEVTTDASLPAYSHSMLNAIATCPTEGLVRYVANKTVSNASRAMALEAGSAAHEAYGAARLWQVGRVQGFTEHEKVHGIRLFGEARYESMCMAAEGAQGDMRMAMLRYCLDAFYSSGFYDDPSDKRRTIVNIEEALIAYLDRFDYKRNIWVQDRDDPNQMIGIELPIDITITFVKRGEPERKLRFIGTADGLTYDRDNVTLRLEENKTASRLGEAWAMAFHMSHQVTGYLLGLSTMIGEPINKAGVHGMAIPLPRTYDAGGLMTEVVSRNSGHYQSFLQWILSQLEIIDAYGNDPMNAPKYTSACNKWFRACSLIPLCASCGEDRQDMWDMMVERQPTPTEIAMEGKGDD
jgi:hypothetical protein